MSLEKLLSRVRLSQQGMRMASQVEMDLLALTRTIFGDRVYSIGSSARGTFVPNGFGLPGDIDYDIRDGRDLAETISAIEQHKAEYETLLGRIYGREVELCIDEAKAPRDDDDDVMFRQVRYVVRDKNNKTVLLGMDFNYKENLEGNEHYNAAYLRQMERITAGLSSKERAKAQAWITENIRALKLYLSEAGIYKPIEGGFGGLGCEQLMMELFASYGTCDTLEELMENYNMGTALKYAYEMGKDLSIQHPVTGQELARKLDKEDGWKRFEEASASYGDYLYKGRPAREPRWIEKLLDRLRSWVGEISYSPAAELT